MLNFPRKKIFQLKIIKTMSLQMSVQLPVGHSLSYIGHNPQCQAYAVGIFSARRVFLSVSLGLVFIIYKNM
jgi:putative Mn2+ efflux pump MntP